MSVDENKKFMIWHDSQKEKVFNLKNELLEYCKSDVLASACLSFRSLFIEITKINSSDSGVDFMKPNTIGLIPTGGYVYEPTSHKAIIWMKYLASTKKISIKHARNSTEKRIFNYKIDGWDEENRTVYEFHGCVFHGCPVCYSGDTYNPLKNEIMSTTFAKHKTRIDKIRTSMEIDNVIEILECEYNDLIKTNTCFADFVKNEGEIRPPLEPRESFTGIIMLSSYVMKDQWGMLTLQVSIHIFKNTVFFL